MTLTEFLLARIAEDETASRAALSGNLATRVLAECEAKRRIVEMVEQKRSRNTVTTSWIEALMVLAVPYDDHPDYRPEWKP